MKRKILSIGCVLALASGVASAQTGATAAAAPVQLQMPVGTSGLTLGIPLPAQVVRPASTTPAPADAAKATVMPSPYSPQVYSAPPEQAPKARVLKRSEVPEWPQLGH